MTNQKTTSRELASALIKLNNISQGKAADIALLTRQNVSRWLTGRDNALSEEKQLRLLNSLGVRYGFLRSDWVHRWYVQDMEDASLVLGAVLNEQAQASAEIWSVHNPTYPSASVLRLTRDDEVIWVIMYRPLMSVMPNPINAESLRCGKDVGEVVIDSRTWESWLPPAELTPDAFNIQIMELINHSPETAVAPIDSRLYNEEPPTLDEFYGDGMLTSDLTERIEKAEVPAECINLIKRAIAMGMSDEFVVARVREALTSLINQDI